MKIFRKKIEITSTTSVEIIDITDKVAEVVSLSGVREGTVLIYSPHTSAGIFVNHNEPMLLQDFTRVLYRLAPVDERYSHDLFELAKKNKSDGRSNGHSHCKVMLLGVSETVPLEKGHMILTSKQNIFVAEMDGARKRDIIIQVMGL
ncbi:MAG: secondary thiamine-phosphate synthase enzyme YjbQ [Candidatus Moranbacteria bacterium]|nr:secondary thiamine-phosphate synthase enzyme YjbQ [Candidatus Moranbacteria bacterium]